MQQPFLNKVALITGFRNSIGKDTALLFAQKKGAAVVIADWKEDREKTALRQMTETGGKAHFTRCDVSHAGEVKMSEEIWSTFSHWILLLTMPA